MTAMFFQSSQAKHNTTLKIIAGLGLFGFALKTCFEMQSGHSLFVDPQAADFAVTPAAHLIGAATGLLIAYLPIHTNTAASAKQHPAGQLS